MAEVGTAFLTIVPSARGFGSALNGQVTSQVDASGRTQGSRFGSAMSGAMAKTAKVGALAVAAAVGGVLVEGFQRLDAIDQAQAKLRGLGNSASDVSKIMANSLAAVKGTAFGLGDAVTVAAQLTAAGAKSGKALEGQLKAVANHAAAAGVDLGEMGSIYAKAMTQANGVQNDVLGQLQDKGIPIYQKLGEQLGVTAGEVFDLASDGQISFEQFSAAATAASGTVAKEMGGTLSGSLDNAKAALGRLGAALLGPSFASSPALIGAITAKIDAITPAAAKVGEAIKPAMAKVSDAFKLVIDKAGDAKDKFDSVFEFVKEHETSAKIIAGVITTLLVPAFIAWATQATLAAIANTIAWVTAKREAIVSAAMQLAAMTLLGLGWIIHGAKALAGAAMQATAWLISKLGALSTIGAYILAFAVMAAGWIATGVVALVNAAIIAAAWIIAFWPVALVVAAVAIAVVLIIKYWDQLKAGAQALGDAIAGAWDWIKQKFAQGVAWVKTKLDQFVAFHMALPGMFLGIGADIVNGLWNGMKGVWTRFQTWVSDKIAGLSKAAKAVLDIGSPSRVFMSIGQDIGLGLAIGAERTMPRVESAIGQLASIRPNTSSVGGFGSSSSTAAGSGIVQHIHPQPGQSEREIGNAAANRLLFAMAT